MSDRINNELLIINLATVQADGILFPHLQQAVDVGCNSDKLIMIKSNYPINQGYEVWNKWITGIRDQTVSLKNEDFSNFNFRYFNLSKVKFNDSKFWHTNFAHSTLNETLFCDAYLRDAVFINSVLKKTNFIRADLSKALFQRSSGLNIYFREAKLNRAKMHNAQLQESDFMKADLKRADLSNSDFSNSNFYQANLRGVNFQNSNLTGASFVLSNLTDANFSGANLENSNLQGAQLIGTILDNANLNGCHIYGISAWGISTINTIQTNLLLSRKLKTKSTRTSPADPIITVDNLEVAQFIYLLLINSKIRTIIDTITSKVVLILGRFTPERLLILDEIRNELRKKDYLPVLFDFENAKNRDITETVSTLAHLSKFIIADITDAKSIPQELSVIVPMLPSVPVQPLLYYADKEYGMFEHFKNYPWLLDTVIYEDLDNLKNIALPEALYKVEKYLEK